MAYSVEQFVAFLRMMVGQPYWYGTCVHRCTKDMLSQKTQQYSKHYTAGRMPRYKTDIAERKVSADCVGLIKGFFWTNGGTGVKEYLNGGANFSNHYASNGVKDFSAEGLRAYLKQRYPHGNMNTLPEKVVCVFKQDHVGVYVGNGKVIEEQGFAYGCRETNLKERPWVEWAELPPEWIDYKSSPTRPVESVKRTLRLTSPMMRGDDVKELQTKLKSLGYDCGEIDGVFGKNTESALKAFEKARGGKVDGILDDETRFLFETAHIMPAQREHVVKSGDTLWGIAVKYYGKGTEYTKIKTANGLKSDTLKVGQKLIIP